MSDHFQLGTQEIKDDIILHSKEGNVLHKSTAFIGVAEQPNIETRRTYDQTLEMLHESRQNVQTQQIYMNQRRSGGRLPAAGHLQNGVNGGMQNMALSDSYSLPPCPPAGYAPPRVQSMPMNPPPAGGMNFAGIKCGGTRRHQQSRPSSQSRYQTDSYSMDGMEEPLSGYAPPKRSKPDHNKEAHEVIIDLADFTGFWNDTEELWNTLSRYDARITKAEIEKVNCFQFFLHF